MPWDDSYECNARKLSSWGSHTTFAILELGLVRISTKTDRLHAKKIRYVKSKKTDLHNGARRAIPVGK